MCIDRLSGSVMLHMLYGYTPAPHTFDPLVSLINQVMSEFSEATVAGVWLVDSVPWLRYLPEWVPGMGFKRTAREWNKNLVKVINLPVEFVKQQMAWNAAKPSYTSSLFGDTDRKISRQDLDFIKHSAFSLYGGGADTTVATLTYFFLSMTLFPEVQRKAREVTTFFFLFLLVRKTFYYLSSLVSKVFYRIFVNHGNE